LRALLSVANRDGISALARDLLTLEIEIFATDGTREHLAADGIDVRPVSELTGLPTLIGGQVKTFHPAIYAGILARRDIPAQMDELVSQGIGAIDIVVVNVSPFAPAVGAQLVAIDEAIEMIDVGGAAYYAEIAAYLNQISNNTFPKRLAVVLEKVDDLRYGENPHQRAAFYRETTHRSGTLADATQIRGERPSFNNYLDLDSAYRIVRDFTAPTVAIVKHTDPVGVASSDELVEAYRHALETDAVSAFGGIVGVNREMDGATAREIAANSYEAVVAPSYSQAALGILKAKAGLEILAVPPDPTEGMRDYGIASLDFKRVAGGLLVESVDEVGLDRGRLQVVTKRRPTLDELNDLLFAWRSVCHVRSNAIVLARNGATIGIGAAQASRQVAVEIALRRAGDRSKTAVMASDAYFPFPDGIQMAAQAGVTAIIQPGGSIRDEMAIEVADRHHLAMVFTGRRHFRH
jgi:phosphoribosylaminoimidazolecarboxamide formyltransferase/IMP cyclohydrolase